MTKQQKKWLAREWLIFVVCFLVGLFVVPLAIGLVQRVYYWKYDADFALGKYYVDFVADLLSFLFQGYTSSTDGHVLLAVMLGPYVVVQLVRSIVWSVKAVRKQEPRRLTQRERLLMTPRQKKWLAREGLTLLVCLFVGFLVVPATLFAFVCIIGDTDPVDKSFASFAQCYPEILRDLFASGDRADPVGHLFALIFVLGPYVIVQLVRSIVWSVKTVRKQEP